LFIYFDFVIIDSLV